MMEIINTPIFGVMISIIFFLFGRYLYQVTKFPLFNPLLISSIMIIMFIYIVDLDIKVFKGYLNAVNLFLPPLTVSLAIPIVKQKDLIKKNIIPIISGALAGSIASIITVLILGKIFNLESAIMSSLIPKSVTTPIAIEVSKRLGGISEITVAVVIMNAIFGSIIGPFVLKMFNTLDPTTTGMSLGTTSNAVGTAKASEISQTAGAIGGVAIVATGLFTVIITLLL